MNWQTSAVQDLKKYKNQKESLENIPERIEMLDIRLQSIRCSTTDSEPVRGGGSRMEDAMIDNIVERQRLELTYEANKKLVALIERGLSVLTDKERTVLDAFFIERRANYLEYLNRRLGYERAQIYRIKEDALYKFTIAMYGLLEF